MGLQRNRVSEGKSLPSLGSLVLLFAFEKEKVQERKIYEDHGTLDEELGISSCKEGRKASCLPA